ncbi:hypothetical protein Tco_1500929 [Tanacetum coccineum]
MFNDINLYRAYNLDEAICPRFMLEFYSRVNLIRNKDHTFSIQFWFQDIELSFNLEIFVNILGIPYYGQCVYSEDCSLISLRNNPETQGSYHTRIPTLREINDCLKNTHRNIKHQITDKIHKLELRPQLRKLEEIIQQNVSSKTNSPNYQRKTARIQNKSPTYVNLETSSEEHHNERTPSPPPRKKSLSPPHALLKSTSSRSTYQTVSSSPSELPPLTHVAPPPKLRFVIPMKLEPQELSPQQTPPHNPHVSTMDNWPPDSSNASYHLAFPIHH